jgi:hypothetical protein
MIVETTGQESEQNLVDAIKTFAPFEVLIPHLGDIIVTGAQKSGGGSPEPKADVVIDYQKNGAAGKLKLSMKKPNFGFFQNRMNYEKFEEFLTGAGLPIVARQALTSLIKKELKKQMETIKDEVIAEREAFLKYVKVGEGEKLPLLRKDDPSFIKMVQEDVWGPPGQFKNKFPITNIYFSLRDIMDEKYFSNFIAIVVKGESGNPLPADTVLEETVESSISKNELMNIMSKIQTADSVVSKYVEDPKMNMRFRLRPMTEVRTTYSKSNRAHYKARFGFFEDYRVAWSIFVIK